MVVDQINSHFTHQDNLAKLNQSIIEKQKEGSIFNTHSDILGEEAENYKNEFKALYFGVKNIIVFGIPSAIEFEVLNSEYSSRNLSRWEEKLIDITKNKNDFFYVDGFKIIESKKWDESYTKLYLSCDHHWNHKGAELSAQLLKENLKILDIKKLSK